MEIGVALQNKTLQTYLNIDDKLPEVEMGWFASFMNNNSRPLPLAHELKTKVRM